MARLTLLLAVPALTVPAALDAAPPPQTEVLGDAGCAGGEGPAVLANITGLKDRAGEVKLELYPADDADFLKDDRDLIKEGKVFRRVRVPTPKAGPVELCIRAPRPGRYGLLFTHNRDGKNKFDYKIDGAGVVSNQRIGLSKPKLASSVITLGERPTTTTIRVQYLGLFGFSPSGKKS